MAFLVGSKGIGTPTWGHSLKVDPYLWSSKLSFLYDIDYLRNIENLYGNEVLKQYILEKLKEGWSPEVIAGIAPSAYSFNQL